MFPVWLDVDLSLELLEPRHAPELFAATVQNRAHLREWLSWLDHAAREEDALSFIRATQDQLQKNNGFQTAIRFQGSLVGVIGHHNVNWANRSTSLGYWLTRDAQGRGLMTSACRHYITHAFEVWRLNRVEIRCAVGNERSRAIPERLGFTHEGTIRQAEWLYDHFVDHAVYGCLASEWDLLS